jgi:hypothetical protein
MNDSQSRALNAAEAGQTFMDDPTRTGIWSGQAAVASKKLELDNCITDIGIIDDAINDVGGNSVTKTEAKNNAAKTAWIIAKALVAFAEDTNDNVLKGEIDFSWTGVRYGKDVDLMDRWTLVFNRATTHVLPLTAGGYGVNAALLLTFQGQRSTFATWKGKPQAAIANTKALNIDLDNKFVELDKIVESLKTRLVQFAVTSTTFYNGAIDAFEIDMTNVRHQALVIVYEDEDTGIRLPKVKSKVIENQIIKSATERGRVVHMQNELPQGNYSIESTLDNYTTNNIGNVAVENGKLTKLVIKLKKIV